MANRYTRMLHVALAWLFAAGVVFQAFLAGAALTQLGGSGDFSQHVEFGYTGLGILALALLVSALVARVPRREVGFVLGLIALYVVQTVLPNFRGSSAIIAARFARTTARRTVCVRVSSPSSASSSLCRIRNRRICEGAKAGSAARSRLTRSIQPCTRW